MDPNTVRPEALRKVHKSFGCIFAVIVVATMLAAVLDDVRDIAFGAWFLIVAGMSYLANLQTAGIECGGINTGDNFEF
jgi:hypothetical protein